MVPMLTYLEHKQHHEVELVKVNLLALVSCEHASSQTSVCGTDPPQDDNFEHLKCSCMGTEIKQVTN